MKNIFTFLFVLISLPSVAQNTFTQNICPELSEEKKIFVKFTFTQFATNCGERFTFEVIGKDQVSCAFPREWINSIERRMEQRVIRDHRTCDIVWETRSTIEPQWKETFRLSSN